MKLTHFLAAGLLVASVAASAQEHFPVRVTVTDSPARQIALARTELAKVYAATNDNDRKFAIATAAATLEVVPRMWPKARNYVINAAILEGELFTSTNAPRNAIKVLQAAAPVAKGGPGEAGIDLRMARAYLRLHDDTNAEPLLLAAEHVAPAEGNATVFAVALELGQLYSRTHRPTDAAAKFRILARDSKSATNAAYFTMRSARESLLARDKVAARNDLDAFDRILSNARAKEHSAPETREQLDLQHEAGVMRSKHGLS